MRIINIWRKDNNKKYKSAMTNAKLKRTNPKNDSKIMAILLLNNKKTYIHVYIIMYLSICWDSVCWTFHRRQRPSRSSTHFMIRPIGTWSTTNSQCISKYTILPTFFYCEIQQYRIILTL